MEGNWGGFVGARKRPGRGWILLERRIWGVSGHLACDWGPIIYQEKEGGHNEERRGGEETHYGGWRAVWGEI